MPTDMPLRLFFALPCPPAQAETICQWRDTLALGGQPVPSANFHLTLAFLGNQPAHAVPDLLKLAEQMPGEPFTLCLDVLTTIGRGFACLQPREAPAALRQLQTGLALSLARAGIALDDRPFVPHLTLTRHAQRAPEQIPPAFSWNVDRFALYTSEPGPGGVHYRTLGSWLLGGTRDAG